MKDYKERWQEFFEQAVEDGDSDPGEAADKAFQEDQGGAIDEAWERARGRWEDRTRVGEDPALPESNPRPLGSPRTRP